MRLAPIGNLSSESADASGCCYRIGGYLLKNHKNIKRAAIAISFMLLAVLIIVSAIIGFKILFQRYYVKPVPVNPFMSYGRGIDEGGDTFTLVPYDDESVEVIAAE